MQQATVVGQRWTDLPVPELGAWTPVDRVCVVLPARDNQTELERTLAALAHQTYPAELLEVVVVDDSSQPPLTLPALAPAAPPTDGPLAGLPLERLQPADIALAESFLQRRHLFANQAQLAQELAGGLLARMGVPPDQALGFSALDLLRTVAAFHGAT